MPNTHSWIERHGHKAFRFTAPDGSPVKNRAEINYYKSLGIPPAWNDVKISQSRRAKIVATGTDAAGRTQYIYNPTFRAAQEAAKFERILQFAVGLPKLRARVDTDLARPGLGYDKVMATIVSIIDRTHLRIGNDTYARDNNSYGLTTLRSRHTDVTGGTITFDFIGKSGKHQVRKITEPKLARIVKQLDELPGYEVFKYYDDDKKLKDVHSQDVNAYIKASMGNDFSAKDFRTWAGTLAASAELALAERGDSETARKKTVTSCVSNVAKQLGNTPAVARSSYIDPRIIDMFMDGSSLSDIKTTVEQMKDNKGSKYLSPEERCVLAALQN